MKRSSYKTPPMGLGRECEGFRLIELRGEFASFILDLESEVALLGHIIGCRVCREGIRRLIEEGNGRDNWGSALFSSELPCWLGKHRGTILGGKRECPELVDYAEIEDFIEDRIRWSERRLKEILSYAEIELKDLVARLNENTGTR